MRLLLSILCLLLLLLPACYEPIEGCLDPAAENFQLDADRECAACCTYPKLSLQFVHRWITPDTSFILRYTDQVYADASGHPFFLQRITYYLHDFALLTAGGQLQFTADSLETLQQTGTGETVTRVIRDDFVLVNPGGNASLEIGSLRRNDVYTQIQFEVGLDADSRFILPTSLPGAHPLSLLDTTMYDLAAEEYNSLRVAFCRDTSANSTRSIARYPSAQPTIPIALDIPGGFALPAGLDLTVTIQVDYASWFGQVSDIAGAAEDEITTQIVAGVPLSFTLLDIQAQ